MGKRSFRAIVAVVGVFVVGVGIMHLATGPTRSELSSRYLSLAKKIASSVPYGIGPKDGYRTFDDAVAFGSAHCGHYADALLQELARNDKRGRIISLRAPRAMISHTVVESEGFVVDPTLGIVYPYSIGQMIDKPSLADDYIGATPPKELAGYTGSRFFSAVESFSRSSLVGPTLRGYVQESASVSVVRGTIDARNIPYLIDAAYESSVPAHPGDVTVRLTWPTAIHAVHVGVVPDWVQTAVPRKASAVFYRDGKEVHRVVRDGLSKGGARSFPMRHDIAFDTMDLELRDPRGLDGSIRLREIVVNGWLSQ